MGNFTEISINCHKFRESYDKFQQRRSLRDAWRKRISSSSRSSLAARNKSITLLTVAPVCKEDRIIVVGASRGESLDIACRVEADPPAHNFRWKFNNSGETLEVAPGRFSMEKSSGVSVLRYTPTSELDYGTLSCWADNLVGTQSRPCLFQLVAAGECHDKLRVMFKRHFIRRTSSEIAFRNRMRYILTRQSFY